MPPKHSMLSKLEKFAYKKHLKKDFKFISKVFYLSQRILCSSTVEIFNIKNIFVKGRGQE